MVLSNSLPYIRAPIVAIMLFQVAALFLRSLVDGKLVDAGADRELAKNLSYLLVVPVVEIVLFWPILRDNRHALFSLFRAPASWRHLIIAAVSLGIAARLAGWSFIVFAAGFGVAGEVAPGLGTELMLWYSCPPLPELMIATLVVAMLIPVGEEVINRGLILGTLVGNESKAHVSIAVVVSATLFAIMHEPNGMPAAFLIGLLFAVQTLRSQSLLPSIISHAAYNFMRILDWICLRIVWHPEPSVPQVQWIGAAALLVGLLMTIAACWLTLKARTGAANPSRP